MQSDLFAAGEASSSGKVIEGLDREQAAAATAPVGKGVVVRAGAGTGKTRVIVARVAHLVGELGAKPSDIVLSTFTNRAAAEIRERVGLLLGEGVAKGLKTGTFHSLGARFLRRHAEAAGLERSFVVLDDDDAKRTMREAIVQGGHAAGDAGALLDAAFRAVRRWKTWGLSADEAASGGRGRSSEENRFARVYVAYQHELSRKGMVDFGDLVLTPSILMEADEDLRMAEAASVVHLVVDEAQDANPAQVRFARNLSSVHRNVFAVGDEDQSIFSFQGGYPGAIPALAGPGAAVYTLSRNRRCTDEILAPACALVGLNPRSAPKVLRSGRSGREPEVVVTGSEREEGAKVAERISSLLADGAAPSDIAVLARSTFALSGTEEAMIKAGHPYEISGGASFVDREEVRDVVAYLRLALDPEDSLAFERIANKPTRGIGTQGLEAILSRQSARGGEFHEACAGLTSSDGVRLGAQHREGLAGLARGLKALDLGAMELPPSVLMAMILDDKGLGYRAFVAGSKDKSRFRRLESLDALVRIASEEGDLVTCLDRIALSAEVDVSEEIGKVRLSTVHSAKGLEWDHVLCVGFDNGVIPSPKAMDELARGSEGDRWDGPRGGGIEEERRLAHVAFTRAKLTLTVHAPLSRSGRGVNPSRFLPEAGLDPYAVSPDEFDPFASKRPAGGRGVRSASGFGRKGFARRS